MLDKLLGKSKLHKMWEVNTYDVLGTTLGMSAQDFKDYFIYKWSTFIPMY